MLQRSTDRWRAILPDIEEGVAMDSQMIGKNITLHHDRDSEHTLRVSQATLEDMKLRVLD